MAVTGTEPISAANLQAIFNTDGGSSPIADAIYPVGSIYMSVNSTNPQTLFGGTWQRIQGRFLFAADSAHAAGTSGGEETHKLTVAEMPSHGHIIGRYTGDASDAGNGGGVNRGQIEAPSDRTEDTDNRVWSAGGNQSHNNMPPYLAVYIWKRVA